MVTVDEVILPTWDLTPIYPGVDSPEYAASVSTLVKHIENLESLLDGAESLGVTSGHEVTTAFERILDVFNDGLRLSRRNRFYLQAHVSANSRDNSAIARLSEYEAVRARRLKAAARFIAWVGRIDIEALIAASNAAREHAFPLRQAQIEAAHLMDQSREALSIEMQTTGSSAWSRLQDVLASQIMVTIDMPDGVVVRLPMGETSKFSVDPDRNVRRAAYKGKTEALLNWETPFAAALNGVKGEHIILARERGWASILDEALFLNHIDRATLDAMLDACRRRLPDFRRYLKAKARALGIETLASYDLYAPMPGDTPDWPWEKCGAFVVEQFDAYSPDLGRLARRALAERWIDAGPRADKDGGAFCMPFDAGVSRVLMNHVSTFDDVAVLAHELGHAYHNLCEVNTTPWRREATPLTLAETASTFCETLITKAAIAQGSAADKLATLDASLQVSNVCVVEILGRFDFEQAVIDKRAERELSADEYTSLMGDVRRATYGEALDPDAVAQHNWEGIPHFYMPEAAFYNFPYTFGLLFGLGLYAIYRDDPDSFRAQFRELLASTGDADAATLAARFGFDVRSPGFWEGSLDLIRADIDHFVELVDGRFPPHVEPEQRASPSS